MQKKLDANATKMGEELSKGLKALVKKFPKILKLERGIGLMRAVIFAEEYSNVAVCKVLREEGLLLIPSGANGLRFLPPLIVKSVEIKKALKIFEKVLERL